MHRLVLDLETGGLDPRKHAIMTLYMVIYTEDWVFLDELDLQLKPDKMDPSQYTQGALKVTGINLGEHLRDPKTLSYAEGRIKIMDFLQKHKISGKKCHYRPHGQNVTFDVNFLKFQELVPESEYSKLIHHTVRDTFVFAEFLKEMNFLPDDMSTSLGALAEFYGIPPASYHNAKEDVGVTVKVYRAMIEHYTKDKNKALSGISDSILNVIEGR